MPYRKFNVGDEALAADVNNYLMEQTVARFTNASQRTTDLPAPEVNQLSCLDTAKGIPDYWNGTAWKPQPFCLRRYLAHGGGPLAANATVDFPLGTLTMPFEGSVQATAVFQFAPGPGGGAARALAWMPSPFNVFQFSGPNADALGYYHPLAVVAATNLIAAGTAVAFKASASAINTALSITGIACVVTVVPEVWT